MIVIPKEFEREFDIRFKGCISKGSNEGRAE